MKQERDKPLLYWMLIRAFMPSVLLLLFFLIFFLVVLNFASRHNQELTGKSAGQAGAGHAEPGWVSSAGFILRSWKSSILPPVSSISTCMMTSRGMIATACRRSCTRRPMSFVKVIIISRMHICIFPNWTKPFLTSGSISLRRSG